MGKNGEAGVSGGSTPRRIGLVSAMVISALLMTWLGFLISGVLAFGSIMLLARGAYSATDQVIAGSWPRQASIGREIQGQVLGLIGCGNVARETAKRAKALGMSAIAHDPYDDCSQSGRPSRSNKMTDYVLSPADAQNLIVSILKRHETSTANALHVAKALVAAEMDGQRGHGLSRVPSYAAQSASGKVDGRAVPVVAGRKSGAVRIDAANGFAYPALDLAISELTTLTKETGTAAASVFRSHHFGQAGYHAERLAENGLVALVFGNSPKAIAPWGGSKGLFGTNPIAFAAPRSNSPPLLIDLSLSKVARGKVMVAQQKGEPIPEGWALDENGQSTTDPTAALKGTMLPMGEAKGAALVLMVEILAAGLSGAHFGYEATSFFTADGPSPGVGQLILAFDPESLSGGSFSSRLEELISEILTQDNVRLPGTRRIALRQKALHDGIRIPSDLFSELNALNQR